MPSLAMRASAYCETNCAMPRTANSRMIGSRHHPQGQLAAREAAVEQRLEQRRHQRLGEGGDQRGDEADGPPAARAAEPGHQPREAARQGRARARVGGGGLHGGGFYGSSASCCRTVAACRYTFCDVRRHGSVYHVASLRRGRKLHPGNLSEPHEQAVARLLPRPLLHRSPPAARCSRPSQPPPRFLHWPSSGSRCRASA